MPKSIAMAPADSGQLGQVDDEFLDLAEVCAFFGGTRRPLHPSTIMRGVKLGIYPKPRKVAKNSNRWLRGECAEAKRKIIMVGCDGNAA
jgi:predicted DNA-binding transcriptional regulator AlpA